MVSTTQTSRWADTTPAEDPTDPRVGDVVDAADTTPGDLFVTPLTPDTAPVGLSVRRSRWVAPSLLAVYAVVAARSSPSSRGPTFDRRWRGWGGRV